MADLGEDPIEQGALRQEIHRVNMEKGKPGLLRVKSSRSSRGEDISWTEEIHRAPSFNLNDSSETVIDDDKIDSAAERGKTTSKPH
jgi:hypothetical protein